MDDMIRQCSMNRGLFLLKNRFKNGTPIVNRAYQKKGIKVVAMIRV